MGKGSIKRMGVLYSEADFTFQEEHDWTLVSVIATCKHCGASHTVKSHEVEGQGYTSAEQAMSLPDRTRKHAWISTFALKLHSHNCSLMVAANRAVAKQG